MVDFRRMERHLGIVRCCLAVARFILVWSVAWTSGVIDAPGRGACARAPAPSPAMMPTAAPHPVPAEIPKYFQPFEAEAVFGMLKAWNDSGTNASALMPGWASNRTHPCNYTWGPVTINGVQGERRWFSCWDNTVHIGNRTGKDVFLAIMNIVVGDQAGGVELVGELPVPILNLTDILYIRIDGHRRLSGALPKGMLKAFPSIKSLSLTRSNLSGSITIPANSSLSANLDELDLSDNAFTGSTPFCQNAAANFYVRSLNLSTNQLSGVFCSNDSTVLELLDISKNQFTNVDISQPKQSNSIIPLKVIYAQHNRLQSLPRHLLELPQLEELYFDSNIISGVLTLPYISPMKSLLRIISLTNNNITALRPSIENPSLLSESSLRISDLLFLGGNPICESLHTTQLLRLLCRFNKSSPIQDAYNEPSKIPIIISACISAVVLLAFIVTLFVIKKLMKKISTLRKIQAELNKRDVKPNLYSYTELKLATQDFHSKNEVGRGGFGVVYKGVFKDGSKVAVKRLSKAKGQKDIQDFLNEIIIISNVKHRNLVQLKGCCIRGDQRILVHELVDNMNLATTLWGNSNGSRLNWPTRFNIVLGIARGLTYLHEEVEPSIIHRDIKGSNILLDKDLNPKIADFGLALFFPLLDDGETHMSISKIAGTMGYLSPEYATYGQVSTKLDVYSFGVLLLETVSGRKNIDYKLPPPQQCLTQWAQRLHSNNQMLELVDKSFEDLSMPEGATIKKVVEVGLLCLHHSPARRPTMSNIVAMLIGNTDIDRVISFDGYEEAYAQEDGSASSSIPSIEPLTLSQVQEVFES